MLVYVFTFEGFAFQRRRSLLNPKSDATSCQTVIGITERGASKITDRRSCIWGTRKPAYTKSIL